MKTIIKQAEPKSLTEHRSISHSYFANYANSDDLRQSLVSEQRGICCYCLSRIRAESTAMKIEHWHCVTQYPNEQLDYTNLLGACLGQQGDRGKYQHCDTHKGDLELSICPANPFHRVESQLHFRGDGRIESDDPALNAEIEGVLNLNTPLLKANRKATLDAFTATLGKRGTLQKVTVERFLEDWNGQSHPNQLLPYCQVIVYWLQKRLARI